MSSLTPGLLPLSNPFHCSSTSNRRRQPKASFRRPGNSCKYWRKVPKVFTWCHWHLQLVLLIGLPMTHINIISFFIMFTQYLPNNSSSIEKEALRWFAVLMQIFVEIILFHNTVVYSNNLNVGVRYNYSIPSSNRINQTTFMI